MVHIGVHFAVHQLNTRTQRPYVHKMSSKTHYTRKCEGKVMHLKLNLLLIIAAALANILKGACMQRYKSKEGKLDLHFSCMQPGGAEHGLHAPPNY